MWVCGCVLPRLTYPPRRAEDWCTENLLREGIAPERASCLTVEDFQALPLHSGNVDVIAIPFLTSA